ncbi:MAG: PLP-dependent aminotransferase family protein [Alphaproteobacteria bacterium]
MSDFVFHLRRDDPEGLQGQLRRILVAAILDGQIAPDSRLPSCRKLARRLGVARNTVVLAYQSLIEEGYLVSRERSGYFVDGEILRTRVEPALRPTGEAGPDADWSARLKLTPSREAHIVKPPDWQKYPYPFIYGQVDPDLFPLTAWRECSRQALAKSAVNEWANDRFSDDDPLLVEQVRSRALLRRGVRAAADEILVTMGAQHALYLLARLLMDGETTVGVEEPGYVDARNIFHLVTDRLKPLAVDAGGLAVDHRLAGCDYVYVTPSHQSPTTVTMPLARRLALLERAASEGFIVIEDDYEAETNYLGQPTSALKSLDETGRVVYIGSFSKALAPGLRLGYMVGPPALIREARVLRRLMLRHPPSNNQRTVALFLGGGHYDALIHRLHRAYRARWEAMGAALARHLPESSREPTFGGTSFWVRGPAGLDAGALAREARDHGVIVEPGAIHFLAEDAPRNYFRLGLSSVPLERIEPGIELLAELIHKSAPVRARA